MYLPAYSIVKQNEDVFYEMESGIMKNKVTKVLSLVLMFALLLSQVAYAKPQGNGREFAPGQLKKMEGYTNFSQSRIRVRDQWMNYDEMPVLKHNRTLIPVRAITEALGCEVLWFNPYAVIVNPEEDMLIIFDLATNIKHEDGKTYVFDDEDNNFEELLQHVQEFDARLADEEDIEAFYEELEDMLDEDNLVALDVAPGLINNRTYVPLRFIAETFGLRVRYNDETKEIDIDDELDTPVLDPDEEKLDEPEDVVIRIDLNGHRFEGITYEDKFLKEDVDYTTTTSSAFIVRLQEEFIEELEEEKVTLEFVFENDVDEEITVEFELVLDYMDQTPTISVMSIEFDEDAFEESSYANKYGNLVIELESNGWDFEGISGLDEDDEYYLSAKEDEVMIIKEYLNDLDDGDYALQFVFEMDDLVHVEYLEIEVN